MKITQQQIEQILEMTTEQLVELSQMFQNVSENLFLECVKYEIENRNRHQARECATNQF